MRPVTMPRGPRADPAPSKWRWRLERLWLTPTFRAFVRIGIPVFAVAASVIWYFSDTDRQTAIVDRWEALVRSVEDRPEFTVSLLRIEGASDQVQSDIEETLAIDLPLSQFQFDLEGLRAQLLTLDPVLDAEVRVKAGGVLLLRVTEREPALVWQGPDDIQVLDATGHRVATLDDLTTAGGLPLIAGPGAQDAVPEALALIAATAPIADRLVGLARVGNRRWDVVLRKGQRIALPEEGPAVALDRALAMHAAHDVLGRDVLMVDLRIPDRPVLRLSPAARADLKRRQDLQRISITDPDAAERASAERTE